MRTLRLDILAAAAAITLLLIYAMQAMIQVTLQPDISAPPTKIGPITMPSTDIEIRYPGIEKPVKPITEVQPPAPKMKPRVAVDPHKPVFDFQKHTLPIDNESVKLSITNAMLPEFKVSAQYPHRALQLGIEAFVTVEFTVTATGATRNVVVVDAVTVDGKPTSLFDRAAIAAAEKFRYKPQMKDGKPVEVHGVRNRFVFEMQQ